MQSPVEELLKNHNPKRFLHEMSPKTTGNTLDTHISSRLSVSSGFEYNESAGLRSQYADESNINQRSAVVNNINNHNNHFTQQIIKRLKIDNNSEAVKQMPQPDTIQPNLSLLGLSLLGKRSSQEAINSGSSYSAIPGRVLLPLPTYHLQNIRN